MAVAKNQAAAVIVKNLSPGPRDYPLASGESIYLPPKGRGPGVAISESLVSDALRKAEKKGAVAIVPKKESAGKEVND